MRHSRGLGGRHGSGSHPERRSCRDRSLNLIERDDEGRPFLTAIDGNRYPAPAFDDVRTQLDTPAFRAKLAQGFDTLILVPCGLSLDRLLDAWREGLGRNATTLRTVGQFSQAEAL